MSKRNKLQKFAEVLSFPNVYENYDPDTSALTVSEDLSLEMGGKWNTFHFKNENPLVLELACGRGEYTLALAAENKDKNYIGIDIKGARIWKGARAALEMKLANVAFLRTRIEFINNFFAEGEVSEIWITFPDPFLRKSKSNRRLTSTSFLNRYYPLLREGSLMHLKTDDDTLYDFSVETINEHPSYEIVYRHSDIYSTALFNPDLQFKTYYEEMHLANKKKIKYIQAKRL